MVLAWIEVTPKFQEGVTLINSIETSKLRLLLNRITSFMQRDASANSAPFTEEEEAKLEKSLNLEIKNVQLVVDTASLILQQAAYHVMKPDTLKGKLTDSLNVEEERAATIVAVWSSNASSIVEMLRKRSVLPHQLADVTWLLNIEASSDKKSRLKEPVAVLELLLQGSKDNETERVKLEMRKPQLQQLYQNLEKIQFQLDALK